MKGQVKLTSQLLLSKETIDWFLVDLVDCPTSFNSSAINRRKTTGTHLLPLYHLHSSSSTQLSSFAVYLYWRRSYFSINPLCSLSISKCILCRTYVSRCRVVHLLPSPLQLFHPAVANHLLVSHAHTNPSSTRNTNPLSLTLIRNAKWNMFSTVCAKDVGSTRKVK